MPAKKVLTVMKYLGAAAVVLGAAAAIPIAGYLKLLPWIVSNDRFISYAENIVEKTYSVDVDIKNPYLKTGLSPEIALGVGEFKLSDAKNPDILAVKNIDINISLKDILSKKSVILNSVSLDGLYADVNKITALPFLNQKKTEQKPSEYSVDIFNSSVAVKNIIVLYDLDKNTKIKLNTKNFEVEGNSGDKKVSYIANLDIKTKSDTVNIKTTDANGVFIKDNNKISIDNAEILVSQNNGKPSAVGVNGFVDTKYNYSLNLNSRSFKIPAVINLLDSQIVPNNLSEQLVYFKDINGDFDFDITVNNKGLDGKIKLNKMLFKLVPFMDLPVTVTSGDVDFDDYEVGLKNFKGFYNNKPSNRMSFSGTVKDYLKSVDIDIVGDSLVTNDFAQNYLSKMLNYPIQIKGESETKLYFKSKYNKMDIKWLYWFKKGNGFIVDGETSYMNDAASRVLSAKMHLEDMLLEIKSMDYYAGNPGDDMSKVMVPIVSLNGVVDFSNGETFVRKLGLELKKPMPSGFINMLAKQRIFRGGTFTGNLSVLNRKGYPMKIKADMKAEKVAIPSQRLFIKNGEFKTNKDLMSIAANGRFRRSAYDISGSVVNELKFPIIVKNITLAVDEIDIDRYLRMFNQMQSTKPSEDMNAAIAESIEKNADADVDDEVTEETFDLANLIIEECILKVQKGFYKKINFANVAANMSLDENSMLKIKSNRFEIAEGHSSADINCDLKNHKYEIKLGIKDVNSDIIATSLLNLSNEIDGKASGLIHLNTDDSLKLNGIIRFKVDNGVIGKVGLIEYLMKVAALFRNPFTMISPSVISDLVNIPEGRFDKINGELVLKDNVVIPMHITSSAPQLSSYIVGTYNLETQDAALRIYTKFSNRKKGVYGLFRNFSLNSLANRIPLGSRNDANYYASEISKIPAIDADEKDCQIFLTKVDGDVEHNNFISSLKKLK